MKKILLEKVNLGDSGSLAQSIINDNDEKLGRAVSDVEDAVYDLKQKVTNISFGIIPKGDKANEAEIKAVSAPQKGDTYRALDTNHYWTFDGSQWNDVGNILPSDAIRQSEVQTSVNDSEKPVSSAAVKAVTDSISEIAGNAVVNGDNDGVVNVRTAGALIMQSTDNAMSLGAEGDVNISSGETNVHIRSEKGDVVISAPMDRVSIDADNIHLHAREGAYLDNNPILTEATGVVKSDIQTSVNDSENPVSSAAVKAVTDSISEIAGNAVVKGTNEGALQISSDDSFTLSSANNFNITTHDGNSQWNVNNGHLILKPSHGLFYGENDLPENEVLKRRTQGEGSISLYAYGEGNSAVLGAHSPSETSTTSIIGDNIAIYGTKSLKLNGVTSAMDSDIFLYGGGSEAWSGKAYYKVNNSDGFEVKASKEIATLGSALKIVQDKAVLNGLNYDKPVEIFADYGKDINIGDSSGNTSIKWLTNSDSPSLNLYSKKVEVAAQTLVDIQSSRDITIAPGVRDGAISLVKNAFYGDPTVAANELLTKGTGVVNGEINNTLGLYSNDSIAINSISSIDILSQGNTNIEVQGSSNINLSTEDGKLLYNGSEVAIVGQMSGTSNLLNNTNDFLPVKSTDKLVDSKIKQKTTTNGAEVVVTKGTNIDTERVLDVEGKMRAKKLHLGAASSDTYVLDVSNITYTNSSGTSKTTEGSRFKDNVIIEDGRNDTSKSALQIKKGCIDFNSGKGDIIKNTSGNTLIEASNTIELIADAMPGTNERNVKIHGGLDNKHTMFVGSELSSSASDYNSFTVQEGRTQLNRRLILRDKIEFQADTSNETPSTCQITRNGDYVTANMQGKSTNPSNDEWGWNFPNWLSYKGKEVATKDDLTGFIVNGDNPSDVSIILNDTSKKFRMDYDDGNTGIKMDFVTLKLTSDDIKIQSEREVNIVGGGDGSPNNGITVGDNIDIIAPYIVNIGTLYTGSVDGAGTINLQRDTVLANDNKLLGTANDNTQHKLIGLGEYTTSKIVNITDIKVGDNLRGKTITFNNLDKVVDIADGSYKLTTSNGGSLNMFPNSNTITFGYSTAPLEFEYMEVYADNTWNYQSVTFPDKDFIVGFNNLASYNGGDWNFTNTEILVSTIDEQIIVGSEDLHLNLNTNIDNTYGNHISVDTPSGKETIAYLSDIPTINVVNNLYATSTTDALSANMGKTLASNLNTKITGESIQLVPVMLAYECPCKVALNMGAGYTSSFDIMGFSNEDPAFSRCDFRLELGGNNTFYILFHNDFTTFVNNVTSNANWFFKGNNESFYTNYGSNWNPATTLKTVGENNILVKCVSLDGYTVFAEVMHAY